MSPGLNRLLLDFANPADRPLGCRNPGLVMGEQVGRGSGGVLIQASRQQVGCQFWNLGRLYQFELAFMLDLVGASGKFGAASSHGRMVRNRAKAEAEGNVSRRPPARVPALQIDMESPFLWPSRK